MDPRTRENQQMAIGILAIATAAMGFALWQQDFDLTYPSGHSAEIVIAYWVAIAAPFVAAIFYFLTFITVGEVLVVNLGLQVSKWCAVRWSGYTFRC